jgi:hypothetical protein
MSLPRDSLRSKVTEASGGLSDTFLARVIDLCTMLQETRLTPN